MEKGEYNYDSLKKEADYVLYEILKEDRDDIKKILNRVNKSKNYRRFYFNLVRIYISNEDYKEMKTLFFMKENLHTKYSEVYKLINFLVKEDLCVFIKNPSKKKDARQGIRLKHPEIHKQVYKRIVEEMIKRGRI